MEGTAPHIWTRLYCLACVACLVAGSWGTGVLAASDGARPPIVIGASLSLTGNFAADGLAFKQGYLLWEDAVNKSGGLLGRPVTIRILDDGSSASRVTANYQQLIARDHVNLLFGPFSTLLTLPASVVAGRYGYALVEGAGGGPSVFTRGLRNVFDVSLPVVNLLTSFTRYILSLPASLRPKTAAYATEDDPFAEPQVALARSLLEKGGVRTICNVTYSPSTTNYAPVADKVANSQAQVAVLGTYFADSVALVSRFRQTHYNPEALIATSGPDQGREFTDAVGLRNAEGIFVPNGWYPEAGTLANADMVKAYLARYGGTADSISADVAEAYAVGQVLSQAVTRLHSLDNASLTVALHLGTYNSVQGLVEFDRAGRNIRAEAYLFQWQNGIFLPVFPESAAAAVPEFPKPRWQ